MAENLTEDVLGALTNAHRQAFQEHLVAWFDAHRRAMPWREADAHGRRDPYHVWVSEVMLQQTRVETVIPYFYRFTDAFPTVEALAAAAQDEVLKLWEGLGYYSRARNLHTAARKVVNEHAGRVPDTEEAIRKLPGVGPYTAAAVLSLAYDRPLAVLDGNVIRVLTRTFGIEADAKASATRRALQTLADTLLPQDHPGRFNEAMMELGATVCTPRSPACPRCPLNETCAAHAESDPERFPVTAPSKPVPHREIAVGLLFDEDGRVLVQQRPEDAMLGGLWEFPGGKQEEGESIEAACRREMHEELGIEVTVDAPIARVSHAYSHFTITLHAFRCTLKSGTPTAEDGQPLRWASADDLEALAMPRANRKILERLRERRIQPSLF